MHISRLSRLQAARGRRFRFGPSGEIGSIFASSLAHSALSRAALLSSGYNCSSCNPCMDLPLHHSVFNTSRLVFFFLVLGLACWMIGKYGLSKGLLHSVTPTRAAISRPNRSLQSSASPLPFIRQKQSARMFHQAVATHNAGVSKQKTLPQNLFPSSSPTQAHSTNASSERRSLYPQLGTSILQPSRIAPNAPYKKPVPSLANQGIKRTQSGLQKASSLHGMFEDNVVSGSASRPILLDENESVAATVPVATSTEFFEEDDFDSDIDLDVEDPTLMNQLKSSASKRPTFRPVSMMQPTLPRQQHAVARPEIINLEDPDFDIASAKQPPPSSTAIPWSSSPPTHPSAVTPSKSLGRFAFTGHSTTQAPDRIPKQESKPAKRRTIPWKVAEEQEAQAAQNGPPPPQSNATARTPHAKTSHSLWNATASAVKEQQKVFREVNKKKSKINDIPDEALAALLRDKPPPEKIIRIFLSEEQQHVLDLVVEKNRSVFFTGSAGTGKSVLLREIIATLRKKHQREPDRVAVTASTGLAACNIGGVTLHSFAGIGLGKEQVPELVKKIRRNQKAKQRWLRTKVLVMDEVSMVDGDLFDKLEEIARHIRSNGRPFGGIQIVITGDFFQLPPVPDNNRVAKFAFDASSWTTSVQHTIGLHQVFRQKDPVFAGMLNEMREGRLSKSSIEAFQKLSRPLSDAMANTMATELFPTRREVDMANDSRMRSLVGEVRTYEARDGGTIADKVARDRLLQHCMASEVIHLKKGAQVMLIKNIDESLVNGSIGKVIGFMNEHTFDRYMTHEEEFFNTQHDGIKDEGSEDKEDPEVARKSRAMARITENLAGSTSRLFPVVRFTMNDNTTRDLLCQPELWKIELPNGEVQASRSQIPLILAWALSIHKAQGQTLERVKVDLGKVFEKGQAYVALSRATNMAGLQVLRFDASKVMAHERVKEFYSNLDRLGDSTSKKRKTARPAQDYERDFLGDF